MNVHKVFVKGSWTVHEYPWTTNGTFTVHERSWTKSTWKFM